MATHLLNFKILLTNGRMFKFMKQGYGFKATADIACDSDDMLIARRVAVIPALLNDNLLFAYDLPLYPVDEYRVR